MRIYYIYKLLSHLLEPVIKRIVDKRVKSGREDPVRYVEKMGMCGINRPDGKLVWIHAVSVGESISALGLIEKLEKQGYKVLLTTTTITSSKLIEQRLPKTVIHQYYPIDVNSWVGKFLDHWKPDVAVLIESELWFNMLENLKKRGINILLLNARMSAKTISKYESIPFVAKALFSYFSYISTQTHYYKNIIQRFAKCDVESIGNLKHTVSPVPADKEQLKTLQSQIKTRTTWTAVSTHKQDEEFILPTLDKLYEKNKKLLTIIVPRHPNRLNELLNTFNKYKIAVRSRGEKITADTQIYIADTIGEMGLFLEIANICFVGGSTGGGYGGHNSLEPAKFKNAIIQGVDTSNFAEVSHTLSKANGHIIVNNSDELYNNVDMLLNDSKKVKKYADNAYKVANSQSELLDILVEKIQGQIK